MEKILKIISKSTPPTEDGVLWLDKRNILRKKNSAGVWAPLTSLAVSLDQATINTIIEQLKDSLSETLTELEGRVTQLELDNKDLEERVLALENTDFTTSEYSDVSGYENI